MPTTVRYPEPTQQQLAQARGMQLFLRDGRILSNALASVTISCMDGRHDKRKISAQCADYVMRTKIHEDTINQAREICIIHDNLGNEEVNLKAFNVIRGPWLSAYNHGSAGGRYASDALGGYLTIRYHGQQLTHVFLADHDGCKAEAAGTRVPWQLAVQWTMHDLWRADIPEPVAIMTCHIQTHGSQVTTIRQATVFDPKLYRELVANAGSFDAVLPTDTGDDVYCASISALAASADSATEYRRFLLQKQHLGE